MGLFDALKKQFGEPGEQAERKQVVEMQDKPFESSVETAENQRPMDTQVTDTTANRPPVEASPVLDELEHKSYPIVEPGSTEEQIKGALRQIYDPEIGLEVVQLGLIREIGLQSNPAEIKMMLTTPFCPYGGWLIQQVKDVSESIIGRPVKIDVLPDLWDPNMMEDPGLLSGW